MMHFGDRRRQKKLLSSEEKLLNFAGGLDYIGGVRESIGNSPDRYFQREGMDRSRRSQAMMDDYQAQARGIARDRYEVRQHIDAQDLHMREYAVKANKYATAMARAGARKRRLGLPYVDTGARIQMNRAMYGLERQAPKLYQLDEIDDELFDRQVSVNARRSTEGRYPSSYDGGSGTEFGGFMSGAPQINEEVQGGSSREKNPEHDEKFQEVITKLFAAILLLTEKLAEVSARMDKLEEKDQAKAKEENRLPKKFDNKTARSGLAESTVGEIDDLLKGYEDKPTTELDRALETSVSFSTLSDLFKNTNDTELKKELLEAMNTRLAKREDMKGWQAKEEDGKMRLRKIEEGTA